MDSAPSQINSREATDEFLAAHRLASATLPSMRLRALISKTGGSMTEALRLSDAILSHPSIALTEKQRERLQMARTEVLAPALISNAQRLGIWVLPYFSDQYPVGLRELADAPPILFVRGDMPLADAAFVAIVGSRRALLYGREQTERFARAFSQSGVAVVSGGAAGIDTAAHRGALDTTGGVTIAVLGCGVDIAYPAANRSLFAEIAGGRGAVISEYGMGVTPEPWRFPARNRIIAGIAKATLVVEAPADSGAMITARNAGEYGRDVWAIPGSVESGRSRGCHLLIQDGAGLADSPEDVLSAAFGITLPSQPEKIAISKPPSASVGNRNTGTSDPSYTTAQNQDEALPAVSPVAPVRQIPPLSPDEAALLAQLGDTPLHLDLAAPAAGLMSPQASVAVTLLEMKGLIERRPGNLFVRRP